MTRFVVFLISIYQHSFGILLGGQCRFHPSCSQYSKEAIIQKGVLKGLWLTACRLFRCQPFLGGGFDPVKD